MTRKAVTVVFGIVFILTGATAMACVVSTNAAIQTALNKELSAKYHNVSVSIDDCVAVLNGRVARLSDKRGAERKTRSYAALSSVVNHIVVMTPFVSDVALVKNVTRELTDNREKNGNMASFAVSSYQGAVTVSGVVTSPMSRANVLALIAGTKGVRSLNDSISIDPVSSLYPLLSNSQSKLDFGTSHVGPITPRP